MGLDEHEDKRAVALRYKERQDRAPKVSAKGSGRIAERIIEIARENDIPLQEDSDLVEVLSGIDLDQEIPPRLYSAVAEMLSWIYRASSELGRGNGK
ncbi:MAG: EscU/YscU/HrcU family type III secretion system export apparatus switch protein [Chitinivibrionales bacterium]